MEAIGTPDGILNMLGAFLISQGPLGILCLLLLLAVWRLWFRLEQVQEARITEAKESLRAMQDYTKSLSALSEFYRQQEKAPRGRGRN